MISNIEIKNCFNNINKKLISNRISVALFSYGLNEFYVAFKYLKFILLNAYNKYDIGKESIKEATNVASKNYKVAFKTIITSLNKLYNFLPADFFSKSPLYLKIKMNCYQKTEYLAEIILNDLQKF